MSGPSTSPGNTSHVTIFDATARCRRAFQEATHIPRLMQQEWAEDRMAEFNLWAAGVGASVTGKASLDDRLCANQETQTIITNLLLMLEILLHQCIGEAPSNQDGKTGSALTEEESIRISDVEDALNQLVRLTLAIRKAGTKSRLAKADGSFNPDSHQICTLRRHLVLLLSVSPDKDGCSNLTIQRLYHDEDSHAIHPDTRQAANFAARLPTTGQRSAVEPLVDAGMDSGYFGRTAITVQGTLPAPSDRKSPGSLKMRTSLDRVPSTRKERTKYQNPRTARDDKMQIGAYPSMSHHHQMQPSPSRSQRLESSQVRHPPGSCWECDHGLYHRSVPVGPNLNPIQRRLVHANLLRRNRFLYAQRHAQKLAPTSTSNDARQVEMEPARTSGSTTLSTYQEEAQPTKFSLPDQSTTTATMVDEPIVIPPKQGTKAPNTVISSSKVIGGNTFFMTKDAWLGHMNKDHGTISQWVCQACSQKNIQVTFSDAEGLTSHLKHQHNEGIKSHHIPMLLSAWRRNIPVEIAACPLCGFEGDEQNTALDHTAEHVHLFALKSLPWKDEEEDHDGRLPHFEQYPYFDVDDSDSNLSSGSHEVSSRSTDSTSYPDVVSRVPDITDHGDNLLTEEALQEFSADTSGRVDPKLWLREVELEDQAVPNMHDNQSGQPESFAKKALYRFGRTLGAGEYGIVREANSAWGKVAVKIILKRNVRGNEHAVYDELNLLQKMVHPHIVPVSDWFESKDKFYIVSPLVTGGELLDRISEHGKYTEKDASQSIRQVLEAVHYLHQRNIIHQDINPKNLRYLTPDLNSPLVLVDCGIAKMLHPPEEMWPGLTESMGYAAPEVMLRKGHGKAVDIWSLGVIAYVLLCGYSPFRSDNMTDLIEECLSGKITFHKRYWKKISKGAEEFILSLLQVNPAHRPSAENALKHPWLKGESASDHNLLLENRAFVDRSSLRIEAVKLENRIKALRMQDESEDQDIPSTIEGLGSPSASGKPGGSETGSTAKGSPDVQGAIFREVVLARVRDMKEREEGGAREKN
ncbi:hypothetical protein FE257_006158 [Aspergillus nanangensis]|uniref:Protein kinase domain-containing protein n=1 Tax=Aspergillus nanangensis TaxID=2582783 RepID=A0AAD4GUZ8_ASPNN|nr:hypothetical protein FE257_006158 [Aspergillus nanangensis]